MKHLIRIFIYLGAFILIGYVIYLTKSGLPLLALIITPFFDVARYWIKMEYKD